MILFKNVQTNSDLRLDPVVGFRKKNSGKIWFFSNVNKAVFDFRNSKNAELGGVLKAVVFLLKLSNLI